MGVSALIAAKPCILSGEMCVCAGIHKYTHTYTDIHTYYMCICGLKYVFLWFISSLACLESGARVAAAAAVVEQAHNSLGAAFIRSKAVVVVIVVFPFFFFCCCCCRRRCAHSHEERATLVAAATYAWLLSSALKDSAREASGSGSGSGGGRKACYFCAHFNILCI